MPERSITKMGLSDLNGMDEPDNVGGRPSKSKDSSRKQRFDGDALTLKKDNKDWWKHKFKRFKKEYDDINKAIQTLADHIAVFPREVRVELQEYGIYETDWEEWIERYPIYEDDVIIRECLIEAGVDVPDRGSSSSVSPELQSMFGSSGFTTTDDDDDGPSDGLQSLM